MTSTLPGSSPLARGLRSFVVALPGDPGIIPARAGFTRDWEARIEDQRDHPRSRGVYRQYRDMQVNVAGSSPLARGLLSRMGQFYSITGIIPARAGFT